MRYAAVIEREGKFTLAHFPDCPGCQTFAEPGQDIQTLAKDALEGWLRGGLAQGERHPDPNATIRVPTGAELLWVDVSPDLSVKLQLRSAREDAGLTQGGLAERAGVSQQMVAKLESPKYHPRIDALEPIVRALGYRLEIEFEPLLSTTEKKAARLGPAKKRDPLPIAAKHAPRRRSRARA